MKLLFETSKITIATSASLVLLLLPPAFCRLLPPLHRPTKILRGPPPLQNPPPCKRMATSTAAAVALAAATPRAVGKLSPATSCLLLCDVQDRFRGLMWRGETVVQTTRLMTGVGQELGIPMIITEQYPKAFGKTCPDIFAENAIPSTVPVYEKKRFSMITPEVQEHIDSNLPDVVSYILCGIEAHVCVQQTALDLLEMGHDVHVVTDAVSSMRPLDRGIALDRMASAGAYLTSAQSLAFMLMQSADHPNFKAVSKLVVQNAKLPNEFNDALK